MSHFCVKITKEFEGTTGNVATRVCVVFAKIVESIFVDRGNKWLVNFKHFLLLLLVSRCIFGQFQLLN